MRKRLNTKQSFDAMTWLNESEVKEKVSEMSGREISELMKAELGFYVSANTCLRYCRDLGIERQVKNNRITKGKLYRLQKDMKSLAVVCREVSSDLGMKEHPCLEEIIHRYNDIADDD